jgi:hypothetical protein
MLGVMPEQNMAGVCQTQCTIGPESQEQADGGSKEIAKSHDKK